MILNFEVSKPSHTCSSYNHRVSVIAHVENDLFNLGLCINICPFSRVNIKHLFLIVCVYVCIGHNCGSVQGSCVTGHVTRLHRDVCSVWKFQTQKKRKKTTRGIKGPLRVFFLLLQKILWMLDFIFSQKRKTTKKNLHPWEKTTFHGLFPYSKRIQMSTVFVPRRNLSFC